MPRSKLVEDLGPDPDPGHYSDLQVLQSPAGWYIGTIWHGDDGYTEPGSRDSQYFATKQEAQDALDYITATDDRSFLRKHP